ncbi:MAG: hypothetical protein ACI9SJ_001945, partial [Flavobacteriaceae bacterium]
MKITQILILKFRKNEKDFTFIKHVSC